MTVQPEPTPSPEPTPDPTPEPPAPTPAPEPKKPDPVAEQRRRADAERKRADSLQKQIDEAKRKEAEEQGRHKELAETERKRAEELQAQLDRVTAERTVERIASNPTFGAEADGSNAARFINPDEALALLPSNTDLTDEVAVTEALQLLAASRPHLLQRTAPASPQAPPPATGTPGTPSPGDKPAITLKYIDSLTTQEVQKLMEERPEEVQAALAAS